MKIIFLNLAFILLSLNLFAQADLRAVNFNQKFKNINQGNANIEVDEVKELIHIMIAITEIGLENDDMIEQKGNYYQDILKTFNSFKDEKIIIVFDSLIKSNPLNYVFLTGNALSYNFKGTELMPDKYYVFPAQSVSLSTIFVNPITTYKKQIEDFAVKTQFRNFYKTHLPFFKNIREEYNKFANLKEQWEWLEQNFNTKIDNYTIMCSPLINGLNYTTTYEDNKFKQIMMVLPPIELSPKMSESQNRIFNTRIMFTEIDHNYVRVPTEKNLEEIIIALKDRAKWVDTTKTGTKYYHTPEKVFNEYITFATYYLYINDKYKESTNEILYAYNDINSLMKERGFLKMKEFNNEIVRLKNNYPTKKIDDLYPELLKWCKTQ